MKKDESDAPVALGYGAIVEAARRCGVPAVARVLGVSETLVRALQGPEGFARTRIRRDACAQAARLAEALGALPDRSRGGSTPSFDVGAVRAQYAEGVKPRALAKAHGVSLSSIYRVLRKDAV